MIHKNNDAYKSIGEVAKILDLVNKKKGTLNTHTIRFWEKEFKQIKPKILNGNRRYYNNDTIEILKKVKYLLKDHGMTINGVKKVLKNNDSLKLDVLPNNSISADYNIKNKLNQLPTDPGVYHFYNEQQKIIYIGKAKNLKNRVKSYFQNKNSLSPKNATMLKHIRNIDWIIVRNEVEALMTEANLIKMHHPKYNIDLRDDKSYPFIRITNEPYPQVFLTRNIIKDGSKYFGPFTDVRHLRRTLKALQKAFPIRSCNYFIDSSVIKEKKISICSILLLKIKK